MEIYEINEAWNDKWDTKEIKNIDEEKKNILDIGFLNISKIFFYEYYNISIIIIFTIILIFIISILKN